MHGSVPSPSVLTLPVLVNIFSAAAAVGAHIRDETKAAIASGLEKAQQEATDNLSAAGARVVERVADNPDVQKATSKLGALAAAPTKKQLQPTIIIAATLLLIGVVIAIRASRAGRPII